MQFKLTVTEASLKLLEMDSTNCFYLQIQEKYNNMTDGQSVMLAIRNNKN